MAGLVRKTSIQFGNAGASTNFGQFGSKEAGSPQTSQDPAVIQGLSGRWQQGWQTAIVSGDKAAYLQDMNGFCFVDSYQLTYLFQMGIPEYDSGTLYFTGSIVQIAANGQQFQSLQGGVPGTGAGQSNNTPPTSASNAFWLWINPPQGLVGSATLNTLQKVTSITPANGVSGSVTLGDSLLAEAGGNVVLASGGIQFPDATVQTTAAASSAAATVQSPPAAYPNGGGGSPFARTLGTTYQNTGAKPLFVCMVLAAQAHLATVVCDSSSTPTTVVGIVGETTGASGVYGTAFFIVLPGYYYKVSGSVTLVNWTEWS